MVRAEGTPDVLFLGLVRGYASLQWTWPYLITVAFGWVSAIARRDDGAMVRVQWYALGGGLLLTLYGLGAEPGEKVDPRLLFALWAGIASLHACYACLIGHVVIALRPRLHAAGGGSVRSPP